MGANNRKRRANKARKRARERAANQTPPRPGSANPFQKPPGWDDGGWDDATARDVVELQVTSTIRMMARRKSDDVELAAIAETLRRRIRPHPDHLLETVLAGVLDRALAEVTAGGWSSRDLVQLVGRNAGERALSILRRLLDGHAHLRLDTPLALGAALQLAALCSSAPRLSASDLVDATAGGDAHAEEHPKLAQVRALLAKAESTTFDEEAEALSAKAQELITKYALDQLVDKAGPGAASGLRVVRLWLDPPYVAAKAVLVHQVASANQCRSASSEHLGFTVVVGSEANLRAVELLVTSLLVQANPAMLRHGRRSDGFGGSRTRSFRRAFLLAYAVRIGQRLRDAAERVAARESDDRLPALRNHEQQVTAAFEAAVPTVVRKARTVSNSEGWAAGVIAADLAQLDVGAKITDRAG